MISEEVVKWELVNRSNVFWEVEEIRDYLFWILNSKKLILHPLPSLAEYELQQEIIALIKEDEKLNALLRREITPENISYIYRYILEAFRDRSEDNLKYLESIIPEGEAFWIYFIRAWYRKLEK